MNWIMTLPQLAAWALIVGGLTALIIKLAGRSLARRSSVLSVFACGAAVPTILLVLAIAQWATAPTLPPPNDAPAMAILGIVALAAIAAPVSFATSALLLFRRNYPTPTKKGGRIAAAAPSLTDLG